MTKPKEIGLLFTPENRDLVRRGLKTQTRRDMKVQPPSSVLPCHPGMNRPEGVKVDVDLALDKNLGSWALDPAAWAKLSSWYGLAGGAAPIYKCPYGNPQVEPVIYYLKEPVQVLELGPGPAPSHVQATVRYVDDGAEAIVPITHPDYQKLLTRHDWRKPSSSMFMLKSFARTWMPGVRTWPERLGNMSESDALAEGCERFDDVTWRCYSKNCPDHARGYDKRTSGRASYMSLWESINGPGSWQPDKWVWCVEFQSPVAREVAA